MFRCPRAGWPSRAQTLESRSESLLSASDHFPAFCCIPTLERMANIGLALGSFLVSNCEASPGAAGWQIQLHGVLQQGQLVHERRPERRVCCTLRLSPRWAT